MAEDFTTQVTNPDGTMTEMATELVNPDGTPNYQAILALLSQGGLGAGLQGAPQLQALIQQIGQLASQQPQGQPQPAPAQSTQPQAKPAQDTSQTQPSQAQQAQGRLLQHGRPWAIAQGESDSRTPSGAADQTLTPAGWQGAQMTQPGQPNVTNAGPAAGQPGSAGGFGPQSGGQQWDTGTPSAAWTLPGQGTSTTRAGQSSAPTGWLGTTGGGVTAQPVQQSDLYQGTSGGQLPTQQSLYGAQGQLPTQQSLYGTGGGQDMLSAYSAAGRPDMLSAYGGPPPTLTWQTPQGGTQLAAYGGHDQLSAYGASGGQLPTQQALYGGPQQNPQVNIGPEPKPWEVA